MNDIADKIKELIITGKLADIQGAVEEALSSDQDGHQLIKDAFIPAMEVVGDLFAESKIFLPEMMLSGMAMQRGLDVLKPHLVGQQMEVIGKVVIATAHGDLHDIGKNLVKMMLEGSGFEVIDLGVNVEALDIIKAVSQHKPDILMLSSLLTTTMHEMENVINLLDENGLRHEVKVAVGGAPVNADFARQIGSDAYGEDAAEAVKIAKRFVSCLRDLTANGGWKTQ